MSRSSELLTGHAATIFICAAIAYPAALMADHWGAPAVQMLIAFIVIAAGMTTRTPSPDGSFAALLIRPATIAGAALLVVSVSQTGNTTHLAYCGAIGLICAAWGAVNLHLNEQQRWIPLLGFLTLCTVPLALGSFSPPPGLGRDALSIVIAASPPSFIAAAIDFDYLRTPWFYQYAPFASEGAVQPGAWMIASVYVVIISLLTITTQRVRALINVGETT